MDDMFKGQRTRVTRVISRIVTEIDTTVISKLDILDNFQIAYQNAK